MAFAGRRDGPLMLRGGGGGGGGKPLSRGSRIAVAVAVGVTLGCVCALLYPDGLFRPSASALHWSSHGLTMQARALPGHTMDRLKHQLVEGKVYALSDFAVLPRLGEYMACSNHLMIYMQEQTVVDEVDDSSGYSIPLHTFEFVDFNDVPSRNGDRSLFTDVIGQIVSVEEMGETWKWKTWRNISFRNVCLRDLRGRELDVALFGDLGRNFDAEQVFKQSQKVPIVAVFAGMLVERYSGRGFTVRSTTASKYYLDLDIPQVQEFRASLTDPHKQIDLLPCQLQNPVNPADLVKSWRTIEELKILNPHELQRNTTFLCKASLKGIDCTAPPPRPLHRAPSSSPLLVVVQLLPLVPVLIFAPDHPSSLPPLLLFADLQHTHPRRHPSASALLESMDSKVLKKMNKRKNVGGKVLGLFY